MFGQKSSAKKTSSAAKSTTKKPAAKKPASKTTKSVSKTQTQELAEYIRQKQPADPEFQYIANEAHYDKVIEKIKDCKKTLWIGTADIKDLYVKDGRGVLQLQKHETAICRSDPASNLQGIIFIYEFISFQFSGLLSNHLSEPQLNLTA